MTLAYSLGEIPIGPLVGLVQSMIAPLSGDLQDLGSGEFGYLASVAGRTESLREHVAECSGRC